MAGALAAIGPMLASAGSTAASAAGPALAAAGGGSKLLGATTLATAGIQGLQSLREQQFPQQQQQPGLGFIQPTQLGLLQDARPQPLPPGHPQGPSPADFLNNPELIQLLIQAINNSRRGVS